MKILSPDELKSADAFTLRQDGIKSIDLMERAANGSVQWIAEVFLKKNKPSCISIFCGLGNNGGDGLAIARLLAKRRVTVEVFIIRYADKCSGNFLINEKRVKKLKNVKIKNVFSAKDMVSKAVQTKSALIIDALFGIGINKKIEGVAAEAVAYINQSACPVIAVDVPSGFYEPIASEGDAMVQANYTLTFNSPKLPFLFLENQKYVGDFSVLDIGLNEEGIAAFPSRLFFLSKEEVKAIIQPRNKFSHKGTFGHALVVAGSYGKMGACVLASRACIGSGAGLVTAHVPSCGYPILQTTTPEIMVEVDANEKMIADSISVDKYDAVAIGPGIGTAPPTQNVLKAIIQNAALPLVLDADALTILSENKTWLHFLPTNSILTPHVGEFHRLVGVAQNSFERIELQKQFSLKYQVIVILKGAYTSIACPDGDLFFNSTGNPGMATAGSGDVLTGMITGFLAQGYSPKQAAVIGVYLHGLAGDAAALDRGYECLMASTIIEYLPQAFRQLQHL